MRQSLPPNTFQNQSFHNRQGSNISMASTGDMGNQGMPGPNRGGFHHGGRGRGFNPNNPPYNPHNPATGYPPQSSFRNGHGQARNSMPPSFQPQPPPRGYANSPQPNRGSPALVPSNPNTPSMPPAMPAPNTPQFYQPSMAAQPVVTPSLSYVSPSLESQSFCPRNPMRNGLYDSNKPSFESHAGGRGGTQQRPYTQSLRLSKRGGKQFWMAGHEYYNAGLSQDMRLNTRRVSNEAPNHPTPVLPTVEECRQQLLNLDLSPECNNFDMIQKALTDRKQNMAGYGYPPPGGMNPYSGPMGHNPYAGYPMHYPNQSGSPAYGPGYGAPPYQPTGPAAMARTPSASEKPNYGSVPPSQPVVATTPQMSQAQPKPPVASGSGNSLPRPTPAKKAIVIKRPDGGIVDVGNIKPSSPAPSRTPPATASAATPPTKPSTPAQTRPESTAPPKTREEIQEELRTKIAQATAQTGGPSADASKDDEASKAESAKAKQEAEEKKKQETEAKSKAEAEAKAKQEADEKAKKEAEDKASKEPAAAAESEEDELERVIREMEEEDRRREAAENEHRQKAEAAKAAAKADEEKNRKAAAAENDRKLREAEREMERLEEEKERKAKENAASGTSVQDLLSQARSGKEVDSVTEKMAGVSLDSSKPSTPTSATGTKTPSEKQQRKPAALNLSLNTKPVEPPQPSAALQSLKTSRFLTIKEASDPNLYAGTALASPNPAVNAAVGKKGQSFKYDAAFLLQFQNVFTEQPSMEFQTQVKSLIGDADGNRSASRTPSSRQGSSRAPSGFPGQIGSFQNPRSMPPGGPPGDRMGMPGGALPRSGMGALGFSQGPGRSFPGSPLIGGRQPSSGGRHDGSRQGSRAGRSGSHRPGRDAQKEAQAAKTMPLTAGMELKPIVTSSTGWKPTSLGKGPQASASGHLEPEMVQRKVKAALNKMTPENFSKISDQILAIANQSKNENDGRTLRQVIQLTFEKATDESHFSSTYAKFCKHMLDQMSPEIKDDAIKDKHGNVVSGGNLFRKYLLNRCQEEFEKGWSVKESAKKSKAPTAELLTDEYYEEAAVKRRGLGLVRFIGELFKLGMLTERIIHGCVHHLVDFKEEPKEAEIESLSYLLRTVGAALDSSEKGRPMMDVYFQRIQSIIDLPELDNRLKFMLMDVRDLREGGWKSSQADKGPKTLDEVRAEAERVAAQKAAEAARSQGRGGGPRPPMGRGDARSFSANYSQVNNTVGMDDLRRLKSGSRGTPGGMTLGPNSMLASRSNSGRRPGGPGGSLGRSGDNSGATSRTGTPPTRESSNAFG